MQSAPRAALPLLTLILGGARSGKSAFAERLFADGGIYVATAEAGDGEMAERIRRHRGRRGSTWTTVEEPLDLRGALTAYSQANRPILVDCLTLWLSNLIGASRDIDTETTRLIDALRALPGPVVLVSNEVGLGIVPVTALGRRFRDDAGRLNQAVAAVADRVVFIVAGLPLTLKDNAR